MTGIDYRDSLAARMSQPEPTAEHPEDYCHRCGGPNLPWWTPSPIWNAVMGYPDQAHDGIVCPQCFAELAEAKGAKGPWRLSPRVRPDAASYTHVDGRTWDAASELWSQRIEPGDVREGDRVRVESDGWAMEGVVYNVTGEFLDLTWPALADGYSGIEWTSVTAIYLLDRPEPDPDAALIRDLAEGWPELHAADIRAIVARVRGGQS